MEYDVEKHIEKEKDISYYDGLAEGIEEGKAQGIKVGEAKGGMNEKISIAKKMLTRSMSFDEISDFTGLTKEEVLKLK